MTTTYIVMLQRRNSEIELSSYLVRAEDAATAGALAKAEHSQTLDIEEAEFVVAVVVDPTIWRPNEAFFLGRKKARRKP